MKSGRTAGSPDSGHALRRAIAETPYAADQVGRLERGDRADANIRDQPDLFLAFAAGELSPSGDAFRYCASNLGLLGGNHRGEVHPDVFAMMGPRQQQIVRDRARRAEAYTREWAEHRRRDDEHLER